MTLPEERLRKCCPDCGSPQIYKSRGLGKRKRPLGYVCSKCGKLFPLAQVSQRQVSVYALPPPVYLADVLDKKKTKNQE